LLSEKVVKEKNTRAFSFHHNVIVLWFFPTSALRH
jgi:hypothetical protein